MLTIYYTSLHGQTGSEAAHRLLARAWEDWYGGAELPPLVRRQGGKPDFAHTAHCSLTHTRTLAAAALCETPVGVDAETIRRINPKLPPYTLTPEELSWLGRAEDKDAAFLRLWTLKEAYLKYTGEGLRRRPRELCFVPVDNRAVLDGRPDLAFGTALRENCILSWCAPGPRREAQYKRIEDL